MRFLSDINAYYAKSVHFCLALGATPIWVGLLSLLFSFQANDSARLLGSWRLRHTCVCVAAVMSDLPMKLLKKKITKRNEKNRERKLNKKQRQEQDDEEHGAFSVYQGQNVQILFTNARIAASANIS